jgi:hypothetical protein
MFRASLYVGASALIWFAEGFLFSRFLGFSIWQTATLGLFYVALFAASLWALRDVVRQGYESNGSVTAWRMLSLAPMVTVIIGSFVSLPVVLLVLALGKLL